MLKRFQSGDTIVEVLFAVTIFSLVVVGSLSLMNQGSAASQRALELTLVRQQIDAQAETLRFLHDAYVARYQSGMTYNLTDAQTSPDEEWYRMMTYAKDAGVTSATAFGYCPSYTPGDASSYNPPKGSVVLDPMNARVLTRSQFPGSLKPATTWSQLTRSGSTVSAEGLWIEPVRSLPSADPNQSKVGYVDFHIRACWDAPGLSLPMRLGTIVRLYEPR